MVALDLPSSPECAAAYGRVRARLIDAFASLDAAELTTRVPGCPAWTVDDLLSHLAGNAADIVAGNLEGVASDAWTDAQVQRGRGVSVAERVGRWELDGATADTMIAAGAPQSSNQLVFDAVTHEQDLYGALGRVAERGNAELDVGLGFVVRVIDGVATHLGLPPLAIATEDRSWTIGDGEPELRLEGSAFELTRAFAGRRTRDELDKLVVAGDFEPLLFFFGPHSPLSVADESLGE